MTRRVHVRLCLLFAMLLIVAAAQEPAPSPRVVNVRAERFHFTPSEIEVTQGEEVALRLKSDDTSHGFHIKETDTNVVIPKRGQGEITVVFAGKKPGRYEFECSHMCGAGHAFMRGVIVVKPAKGGDGGAR